MSGYPRTFFATLAAGIAIVFAVNALVDPFDVFQWVSVPGWNAAKYVNGGRQQKALGLLFDHYDALVIGTSRAEVGYRLDHPAWGGKRVYAATLPGTNMLELQYVYDYAVRHQSVDTVLLGLDFLMFGSRRTPGREFRSSAFNPQGTGAMGLPHATLSLYALGESWLTLSLNRHGVVPVYTKGHRNGEVTFGPRLADLGHAELFRRTIRSFLTDRTLYYHYEYGVDRLDRLRSVLKHSRDHGIRLYLVISPVHATQLETIRAAGLWEAFERWKRDVADVAEGEAGGPVPLWDFTGYSGPPAEPVPPEGNLERRMRWYFDGSHFTERLGDVVLDRVLTGTAAPIDAAFGVRIDPRNVEAHLSRIRGEREIYAKQFPEDVERVLQVRARLKLDEESESPRAESDER